MFHVLTTDFYVYLYVCTLLITVYICRQSNTVNAVSPISNHLCPLSPTICPFLPFHSKQDKPNPQSSNSLLCDMECTWLWNTDDSQRIKIINHLIQLKADIYLYKKPTSQTQNHSILDSNNFIKYCHPHSIVNKEASP